MVRTIRLRDRTFPNQRVEKLKQGIDHGKYLASADVTLHCGGTGKSLKVHKIVLASISERLKNYLVEHEKEGNFCSCFNPSHKKKGKEAISNDGIHLILDHMEWDVLKAIIDFAYSGETKVSASIVDRVCEAAHRLQIKYLKDSFVKMDRK